MERNAFHRTQLIFGTKDFFLNPFSLRYIRNIKEDDIDFISAFSEIYCEENREVLLGSILYYSDYNLSMKVLSEICCDVEFSELKTILQYSLELLFDRFECDYKVLLNDIVDKSFIKRVDKIRV